MGEALPGHIFMSHNAQDKPQVEALARQLLDRGLRPWLDKWEITAGSSWQQALQSAIEQASAVLVCIGAHGLGRVQIPEIEVALDRALQDSARLVIPVFLCSAQDPKLPPFLEQRGRIDLRGGEAAYRQLFAALGTGSLCSALRGAEESPFRGLQAFEERHARWYFGREADLARLLDALRQRRLVVLIGASGSGKSSLVRAGLVPAVRTGELDQSYAWVPLLLRPGAHPLQELALRVAGARSAPRDVAALSEALLRDPGLLADELDLEAVRGDRELRFLLVVDQFEEVFTLCDDRAARAAFIAALLHAASWRTCSYRAWRASPAICRCCSSRWRSCGESARARAA